MKNFVVFLAAVLSVLVGCREQPGRSEPGATYRLAARPEVWRVIPRGQAEQAGFLAGDVVLLYNGTSVRSNDAVREAQLQVPAGTERVTVTVLRGEEEMQLEVGPGPLGVMPVSARYPSSLALALEDIMHQLGLFTDYDWLAALTGESFTFTANADVCRAWWPGGKAGVYLESLARVAGLKLVPLLDGTVEPSEAIRAALERGSRVLVAGGWPEYRADFWGVASRWNEAEKRVYGFTLDSPDELPLTGAVRAAYAVEAGEGWAEPEELLATVLDQALELNQTFADSGWKSGFDAFDLLIAGLDTVPFCPVCGPEESQACFDRLVWVAIADKESQLRFLEAMKVALPDQVPLLDEALGDIGAIVGKLEGVTRSGAQVELPADREKLKFVFTEIEVVENDLIAVYEELIGGL